MSQLHYQRNAAKTECGRMIYRDTRVTNPWYLLKILKDEPEKQKHMCSECVREARKKVGES